MASVAAQRDALKAALDAITTARWLADWPSGQIDCPAGLIRPTQPPVREVAGGAAFFSSRYELLFLAGTVDNGLALAQDVLDPYLATSGASSIRVALETDRTLAGVVAYLEVGDPEDYGGFELGGIQYLGVRIPIDIWGA